MSITYQVEDLGDDSGTVTAHDGGTFVGVLYWGLGADVDVRYVPETDEFVEERTPRISSVNVHPDYRRQGIATEMLRRAREVTPTLQHENRPHKLSPEGAAWRSAVGSASGLFWRVHPAGRPFGVEDATSTPFYDPNPPYQRAERGGPLTQQGYSCFANAWHLWVYTMRMGWGRVGTDVIGFSGTGTGEQGSDGEDLAVPDMRTVRRMSWEEFERSVLPAEPLPPTPAFARWVKGFEWNWLGSWEDTARQLAYLDSGEPAEEEIIRRHPQVRTAATFYPEDLRLRYVKDLPKFGGLFIMDVIEAWVGPERVGYLEWFPDTAQIAEVKVEEGYRRNGIATKMLAAARQVEPDLKHSDILSPDGEAWMQTVGSVLGLTFEHDESQTGGSKWPVQHDLVAMLDGVEVGWLTYLTGTRANSKVLIESLDVDSRFRRRGIASALMDEMQRRHPGASIDHGDRTDDGKAWWAGYTQGKPVTRGRTMASLSGLTFTHHPQMSFSEDKGLYPASWDIIETLAARDPSGEIVGIISWYVDEPGSMVDGGIDGLWVRPDRRRQGIATELVARAKEVYPAVEPTSTMYFTDDGKAFVNSLPGIYISAREHTAGPASDMVPFDRFPVLRPGHFGPRDVTVLRMARKDIDRLHPGQQRKVEEALESLRLGTAYVEAKERPPLLGSYTVRVTNSLRLGLYLSEDQPGGDPDADWIVYWCGAHNYSEAERRMQRNGSLDPEHVGSREITAAFTLDSDWSPGDRQTKWKARAADGRVAGYVLFREEWDDDLGNVAVIDMIETNPAYARQGVATFLYGELTATYDGVKHTGEFTPEGAAWWAKVTGEHVVPNSRSDQDRGRDWTHASRHTAASSIKGYLEMVAQMRGQMKDPSWRYGSFEELVLDLGKEYTRIATDEEMAARGITRATPKMCFANAFDLASRNPDLTYVEGWATGFFPTEHAWVVDSEGVVYDPTWPADVRKEYFGVPLETRWLMQQTLRSGIYGVFNVINEATGMNQAGADLLHGKTIIRTAAAADGLYRGMTVALTQDEHDRIFDTSLPTTTRLLALQEVVERRGGYGRHWTGDRAIAAEFINRNRAMVPRPACGVIWKINTPDPSAVEGDAEVLEQVRGTGMSFSWEKEVTLKPGSPISLNGAEVWNFTDPAQGFSLWAPTGRGLDRRASIERTAALQRTATVDLMLSQDVFYRTHDRFRPFSKADAISTPLYPSLDDDVDEREGYSACRTPWDLWGYVALQSWTGATYDDDVLIFSGEEVGTGVDDEPLVVPDHKVERFISWREFLDALAQVTGRFPDRMLDGPAGSISWAEVADTALQEDPYDPVAQRILADAIVSKRQEMIRVFPEKEIKRIEEMLRGYVNNGLQMLFASQQKTAARVVVEPPSSLRYDRYRVTERIAIHEGSGYHPEADIERARAKQQASYEKWRANNPRRRRQDRHDPANADKWVTSGYTYFTPENSTPGTVAFIDIEVTPSTVEIAFMSTRPDHRGRGLARRLVQEVYDRYPDKKVHWGKIMAPQAGSLYEWFRANRAEQTGSGSNYYSSLSATALHDVDHPDLITSIPEALDLVLDLSARGDIEVKVSENLGNTIVQFTSADPMVTTIWRGGRFVGATARGWGYVSDLADLYVRMGLDQAP